MKGNNTLFICQATAIEMAQEWCDKHLKDSVLVSGVEKSTMQGRDTMGCFEIKIGDAPKDTTP